MKCPMGPEILTIRRIRVAAQPVGGEQEAGLESEAVG